MKFSHPTTEKLFKTLFDEPVILDIKKSSGKNVISLGTIYLPGGGRRIAVVVSVFNHNGVPLIHVQRFLFSKHHFQIDFRPQIG